MFFPDIVQLCSTGIVLYESTIHHPTIRFGIYALLCCLRSVAKEGFGKNQV